MTNDLVKKCAEIIAAAEAELGPINSKRYLDLCADNIPDAPLEDIRKALAQL